uniref:Uncharacterized protein n=1 Tax=Thermosporothrix sp. COM3 TaxID=2490863 RepID=A0A455SMG3_9CHLR|nr:hypothetical protein KTC_28530 [Thermosporothrix sp. COM3]
MFLAIKWEGLLLGDFDMFQKRFSELFDGGATDEGDLLFFSEYGEQCWLVCSYWF